MHKFKIKNYPPRQAEGETGKSQININFQNNKIQNKYLNILIYDLFRV